MYWRKSTYSDGQYNDRYELEGYGLNCTEHNIMRSESGITTGMLHNFQEEVKELEELLKDKKYVRRVRKALKKHLHGLSILE